MDRAHMAYAADPGGSEISEWVISEFARYDSHEDWDGKRCNTKSATFKALLCVVWQDCGWGVKDLK